jgi:hypothetical protein
MSDAPDPTASFAAARANIRDTAKWVMGVVSAVVALMVGATAISQLGAMDTSNPRLWWAYEGLAIGAALSWFPFTRAIAVLKSELMTLREIMAAGKDKPLMVMARDRAAKKLEGQLPIGTLAEFHAHYEELRNLALYNPDAAARAKAGAELAGLSAYQTVCAQTCVTEFVMLRFDSLIATLIFPGVLILAAFATFAWAANPGPAKPGPPGLPPVYQVHVVPDAGAPNTPLFPPHRGEVPAKPGKGGSSGGNSGG